MTIYNEYGEELTFEISDNDSVLDELATHTEYLATVADRQADIITLLKEQNAKLTEMNQYSAYIFAALIAFGLYRFVSGVLSSMFGGG